MGTILYKQFRGDELLKIDTNDNTVINVYERQFNQRIYGSIILVKEDGIFVDYKNNSQPVSKGDCIFLNYDLYSIIKNEDLYKTVEAQIQLQKQKDENNCITDACCTPAMSN
jgi:hypothetical protein